ncbi:MAG: zf-TFIIB domain-containing protein [Candidatus Eremiobacteraeota bacterium]|nr:zf-TFIIB domain-containing protein [Candidatus Eremiobacteraeota bacterium]
MASICPACKKVHLQPHIDPTTGLEIDTCSKCWGIWFDANELGKFFKSDHLRKRFFLTEDVKPAQTTGYVISTKARLCPRCRKPMQEKLFGDVSIDICRTCSGIWLDDGELQRIVGQYKKGRRTEQMITGELEKGLEQKEGRTRSLADVIKSVMSFFGCKVN